MTINLNKTETLIEVMGQYWTSIVTSGQGSENISLANGLQHNTEGSKDIVASNPSWRWVFGVSSLSRNYAPLSRPL